VLDASSGAVLETSGDPGYRALAALAECVVGRNVGARMPAFTDQSAPITPATLQLFRDAGAKLTDTPHVCRSDASFFLGAQRSPSPYAFAGPAVAQDPQPGISRALRYYFELENEGFRPGQKCVA